MPPPINAQAVKSNVLITTWFNSILEDEIISNPITITGGIANIN